VLDSTPIGAGSHPSEPRAVVQWVLAAGTGTGADAPKQLSLGLLRLLAAG